jgi:DNA-binding NtrC family response regulator
MAAQHTVLVVDDEIDVRDAICRVIRSPGYRILRTCDPREAIEILAREDVDVLLSDIDMPGMSGHELMRAARRSRPGAVRVFITGAGTMEAAVRAINEGEVHRFVVKPYEPPALRQLLVEALARKAELAQVSRAALRSERRRVLMAQLEAEHPGISRFQRTAGGAYRVDLQQAQRVARQVGLGALLGCAPV